jgi:hypothetical protein
MYLGTTGSYENYICGEVSKRLNLGNAAVQFRTFCLPYLMPTDLTSDLSCYQLLKVFYGVILSGGTYLCWDIFITGWSAPEFWLKPSYFF